MPTTPQGCHAQDLLLVRAEDLDEHDLLRQVHQNLEWRQTLPPAPAAIGQNRMSQQRQRILRSIKDLQEAVHHSGQVRSHRRGWLARIELFIKRSLRKLVFRHLLQEHRVHLRLVKVLQQLAVYVEEEDHCLRACLDHCEPRRSVESEPLTGAGRTAARSEDLVEAD